MTALLCSLLRNGLWSVSLVSALVILLRLLIGPFDVPFTVRTPLNAEGWLGLSLSILLLTGRRGPQAFAVRNRWATLVSFVALAAVTAAAYWRALAISFLSDDFVLLKLAQQFQFAWPILVTPGGDGFYRPVGYASLALTAGPAGTDPMNWHLAGLALHLTNVFLVFVLANRLGASQPAALLTSAVFAVHGTGPEAVVWLAGRFDLIATLFVLAGLLLFESSRRTRPTNRWTTAAALLCMTLAILSKESAYIFPVLLVLLLLAKRQLTWRTAAELVPFVVTAMALFAYRFWLFSGIGGYVDPHSGVPQAFSFGLSTLKAISLRLWMALYFPVNWSVEPGVWLGAAMITYVGGLFWVATTRPNRRFVMFALGFVVAAALPPLHLLGIGADLANSRVLYLPSVGWALLMGVAFDGLQRPARWALFGIVLIFHLLTLEHNLNSWESVAGKARAAATAAGKCADQRPSSRLPAKLQGVPFFANGFQEAVEFYRKSRPAIPEPGAPNWNSATQSMVCGPPPQH